MITNQAAPLPPDAEKEVNWYKRYFPYRICFVIVKPDGSYEVRADFNKRQMNAALRKGYTVYK